MQIRKKNLLLLIATIFSTKTFSACLSPTELPTNSSGTAYILRNSTDLCSGMTYNKPFSIKNHNITLNCNNALLDGVDYKTSGISNIGFDKVTVKNCRITRHTNGLIFLAFEGRSVTHPVTGKRVQYSRWSQNANQFYNKNDSQPFFAPLDGINLININSYENSSSGAIVRVQNSNILDSKFTKNKLGLYIDADSFNVKIHNNEFSHSRSRSGFIIDGAYNNVISNNKIFYNRTHGIALYKNCGEMGDEWQRLSGANNNVIKNNLIYGHKGIVESLLSIRTRTGIAIGLRQGLTLHHPSRKDNYHQSCTDYRSHIAKWLRIPEATRKSAIIDHKIISKTSYGLKNSGYLGPHLDFADNNTLDNNIIFDNTIGIYIAANNTTVTRSRFFKHYGQPLFNEVDVYFGNILLDKFRRPLKNLKFGELRKVHGARPFPKFYISSEDMRKTLVAPKSILTGVQKPHQKYSLDLVEKEFSSYHNDGVPTFMFYFRDK